jgi:DNA repair exonuclease SbcCD ATPase subunit
MRINRIELTNFRSFAGAAIELPTRVTFLVGQNHAGKSSVLDALKWALVGHCRGTSADGKGSDVLIRDASGTAAMKVAVAVDDVGADTSFAIERIQNGRTSTVAIAGLAGTRHDTSAALLDRLGVSPAVVAACLDSEAFLDLHHADAKRVLMEVLNVKVDVVTDHHVQGEVRPVAERLDLAELDRRYDHWYRERPMRKKALEAIRLPNKPDAGLLPDVAALEQKLGDLRAEEKTIIAATAEDSGRRQELEKQFALTTTDIQRLTSKRLGLATIRGADLEEALAQAQQALDAGALTDTQREDGEQARMSLVDAGGRLKLLEDAVQSVKTHSPERGCVLNPEVECRTPAKEFKKALGALQAEIAEVKALQATATDAIATLASRQADQDGRQRRLAELQEQARQLASVIADLTTLQETGARLRSAIDNLAPAHGPSAELLALQERIRKGEMVIADVRREASDRSAYETARQAQQAAAAALAEAERMVDRYGPTGARVPALEAALADFHTRINEALGRFGYLLYIEPDPWRVVVNGRAAALLSKSERLQVGIALQLAIAEVSGFGFAAIDQVDLFDAENRRAFGALLDATPVQVLAAATKDATFEPPTIDDWTWSRVALRSGVTVVEPYGEAVGV